VRIRYKKGTIAMVDYESDIKSCVDVLINGGTILYPTDTVWGLGCDAENSAAINKVYSIKHRPKNKSLIILVAEARDLLRYLAAPHPDIIEIVQGFDKPTTIVCSHGVNLPQEALSEDDSVAIRVVNEPFCKALIKRLGRPIISTSANISGKETPTHFQEVDKEIISSVDYVVKYRQQDRTHAKPSRLIRLMEDGSLTILRF